MAASIEPCSGTAREIRRLRGRDNDMTSAIVNESELYIAPGGPTYRIVQRIAEACGIKPSVVRRIVVLVLITWVPMCIFALVQGVAVGDTPRGSFLLDFATYVRYFLGIPILVLAERMVGDRLRGAGLQFVSEGLVRQEDFPGFERAIARLARRRESVLAALLIIALAVIGPWQLTYESANGIGMVGWQSVLFPEGHAFRYNLAALWSYLVALPILLFLAYRWLWRILCWTLFLLDVARLNLRLVPTHADRAGGLRFLELAHDSFAIFAFGVGATYSALVAFQVIYEGAHIDLFKIPALIAIAAVLILIFAPLLVFSPMLARIKREALLYYGSMVIGYNRDFEDKWDKGAGPQNPELLGSADIQSLADLGNSFRFVDEMGYMPFGKMAIAYQVAMTCLPALPLILLVVPMSEIVAVLSKLAH